MNVKRLSETEFEIDMTNVMTVTFKIPKPLEEEYERICRKEGYSKSELLRYWISSFLGLTKTEQDIIVQKYRINNQNEASWKVFGVRMVEEIVNEIDEIARRNNLSRADVIRSVIMFKMDAYRRAENEAK